MAEKLLEQKEDGEMLRSELHYHHGDGNHDGDGDHNGCGFHDGCDDPNSDHGGDGDHGNHNSHDKLLPIKEELGQKTEDSLYLQDISEEELGEKEEKELLRGPELNDVGAREEEKAALSPILENEEEFSESSWEDVLTSESPNESAYSSSSCRLHAPNPSPQSQSPAVTKTFSDIGIQCNILPLAEATSVKKRDAATETIQPMPDDDTVEETTGTSCFSFLSRMRGLFKRSAVQRPPTGKSQASSPQLSARQRVLKWVAQHRSRVNPQL